jgi:hypothetical protein
MYVNCFWHFLWWLTLQVPVTQFLNHDFYLQQSAFFNISLQLSLNLLSINPYMIGLTTLLMANDLVTIGNTADTTGPGGNKNLPFNAVNKDIVKCGK